MDVAESVMSFGLEERSIDTTLNNYSKEKLHFHKQQLGLWESKVTETVTERDLVSKQAAGVYPIARSKDAD